MEGFGTVITGTLIEGNIETKDNLTLYPEEKQVKVRQLENHGNVVDKVVAGERTAINLLNVKKEDIERGDVLAFENSFILSKTILCDLSLFDKNYSVKNGSLVNFNFGSRHENAKINIVNNDKRIIAYYTFENPIPIKRNDRYIIRNITPQYTLGGGKVLLIDTERKISFKDFDKYKEDINILSSNDELSNIEYLLNTNDKELYDTNVISSSLNLTYKEIDAAINKLISLNKIFKIKDIYITKKIYDQPRKYTKK